MAVTPDPRIEALAGTVRSTLDDLYHAGQAPGTWILEGQAALDALLAILEVRTEALREIADTRRHDDPELPHRQRDWRLGHEIARHALTEPKLTEGEA